MKKLYRKKHKFGAIATEVDGIKFPSKMEAEYYQLLKHQEKLGLVKIIELQPKVYLTDAKILLKPDFLVFNITKDRYEYRETKGLKLPTYNLKKRLWKKYGPGILIEIMKKGRNFMVTDEVVSEN